jgi:carbamoyl-phosphate synthase small subunit
MKATLILENGQVFVGESIGSTEDRVCEMVFNTSMVGYQEILTDPSYAGQGIVMSYPLIGNYGVNSIDNESVQAWPEAFIVRHLSPRGSNFRNEGTLDNYLKKYNIVGIQGVDTRAITKILRNQGTMNGMITCAEHFSMDEVQEKIKAYRVSGTVEKVSTKTVQQFPVENAKYHIALLDIGEKINMTRCLNARGCSVTLLPYNTKAEEILAGGYDGIMLSNGPGDPADNVEVIAEIKKLYDSDTPIFAVCLGHQLMAIATGATTCRLAYGHRGANHPVRDIRAGRVFITSQNHGYMVKSETVDPEVATVSHVNVNDGTCEGLEYKNKRIFTVQFHPEANPGPKDTEYLFDKFLEMIDDKRAKEGMQNA